jgi:transglutaminase-like putative cysteine protease
VLGYSDVWIPSIGYADSITFSGETAHDQAAALRYNPATGTAVVTTGLAEGDEVEVDAVRQQDFSTESLLETPPASMQLPPVSNIPDVVSAKAVELAGPATSPIEQLRAIESTLQTTGFLSHGAADDAVASRAGQGADRMVELFTRTQLIGDEEQYATAFTLMARSLGYPARVVMGFAPEVADGEGEVTVLGADVTAWSEVAFEGVGWVPFYPTPDETDIPQDQNPKPQSEPQPQVRQPPRTDKDDNDLVAGVEVDDSDSDDDTLFELPGWVIAAGASLLVLLLLIFVPLLLAGAIKARRAARRRSAAAADASAAGAWDELLDRFSELGYDVPSNLTRRHTAVALGAQATTATSELRTVAARSDEAVFSGVEVDRATSDVVWTEAMAAVRLAAAARTRWNRIVARYRISAVSAWAHRVSTLVSTDSASSRRK